MPFFPQNDMAPAAPAQAAGADPALKAQRQARRQQQRAGAPPAPSPAPGGGSPWQTGAPPPNWRGGGVSPFPLGGPVPDRGLPPGWQPGMPKPRGGVLPYPGAGGDPFGTIDPRQQAMLRQAARRYRRQGGPGGDKPGGPPMGGGVSPFPPPMPSDPNG